MKSRLIVGTLAILSLVLGVVGSSSAVINDKIQPRYGTAGIAFSPASSGLLELNPGDVYDGRFTVSNTAKQEMDMFTEVAPYSRGLSHNYLTGNYDNPSDRTKITEWTTVNLEKCDVEKIEDGKIYFHMRVQEECDIVYQIRVPQDAYGGSQHASILVQDYKDETNRGGITNRYRVAYVIRGDIDGPGAHYNGKILQNHVPWLLFSPPATTDSLVENTGNIDFDAKYSVKMNNFFGGKEVFTDSKEVSIFADTKYPNEFKWEGAPVLGLFKVTQKIEMMNDVSEVTKVMLIVPIWLVIIIILVIGLLITARVLKSREKKKRKQIV